MAQGDRNIRVGLSFIRPTHPHWKGLVDLPFTNTVEKKTFVRGIPESLKSSLITPLCR